MVLTLTAWAAITISLKKVLPTTSDLERGIAVPHLNRNVLYALLVFSLYKNETLRFDTVEFP